MYSNNSRYIGNIPIRQNQPNNIAPLGFSNNMGINGYNNIYQSNPYLSGGVNQYYYHQQMKEEQEKRYKQQMKSDIDLMLALGKSLGQNVSEEQVREIFDPQYNYQQQDQFINSLSNEERYQYNTLRYEEQQIHRGQQYASYLSMYARQIPDNIMDGVLYQSGPNKVEYDPNTISSQDFMANIAPRLLQNEKLQQLENMKRQEVRQTYNQNSYNSLLSFHNNTDYTKGYMGDGSLDDQEIKLPSSLSTEQHRKSRQMFLESLLNN